MEKIIHRSKDRGYANHSWLESYHSFSFASYYDSQKMGFGLLRVINDDLISPARGFATHPHENMEIVTIPLKGALKHKDSVGNEAVINYGDVQAMSAGTGVTHSEVNNSTKEKVELLQIWILPEKYNIKPRYHQLTFASEGRKNQFQRIVSPLDSQEEGVLINQQAYFSLIDLDAQKSVKYLLNNSKSGLYVFVIVGEVTIADEKLNSRDAIGLSVLSEIEILANSFTQLLLIEVPMD